MLPRMVNWLDVKINESGEVRRWLYQQYEIILTVQKVHSILKTALTLLVPTMFDWIDLKKNANGEV